MLIGIIGLINYVQDPYHFFKSNFEDSYNIEKHWRIIKPYWFLEREYNDIVIGSSRSQSGFNPDLIQKLRGSQCFNFGLPGMSYKESYQTIKFISDRYPEEDIHLFVGLDSYLMPFHQEAMNRKVEDWQWVDFSPLSLKLQYLNLFGKILFSKSALHQSILIAVKPNDKLNAWKKNGFSIMGKNKFKAFKLNQNVEDWRKRESFILSDIKKEYFYKSIDLLCERPNIKATFIHLPMHNTVRAVLEELEPELYSDYKILTAEYILNKKLECGLDIEIYDYLICNSNNGESLLTGKSEYFRDLSHLRSIYGNKILNEIYGKDSLNLGYKVSAMDAYEKFLIEDNLKLTLWIAQNQSMLN